jgi:adenylosuccinate synthase
MLVDPLALVTEAQALERQTGQLPSIEADHRCLMITPWHRAANRLRELGRGDVRHGSCGRGVGEAVRISIERPDLVSRLSSGCMFEELRLHLLKEVKPWIHLSEQEARPLIDPYSADLFFDKLQAFYAICNLREGLEPTPDPIIFEGGQGVLLDQTHGIGAPDHATWSDTTFNNAATLCDELGLRLRDIYRLGVVRTHLTRHGAGPFPVEDPTLTNTIEHEHNTEHPYQGNLRVGCQSRKLMEYSNQVVGPIDGIAVTHCDWPHAEPDVLDTLEDVFSAPVLVRSIGPTADHRILENHS